MPSPIECDIISNADGEKLISVRLSVVPQRGDELDLDLARKQSSGRYRVVEIRYHVRPRALAGARWAFHTDDLVGISVFVEPISS